jgi:outer membrane protein assembly factor BamB
MHIMKTPFRLFFLLFIWTILTALLYKPVLAATEPFTFLIVTDSHLGSGEGNRNTPRVLSDMTGQYPGAAFWVHMGDVTETGDQGEYQTYQSLFAPLTLPIYLTTGNHESRWNDPTFQNFVRTTGQLPTQSWDYGGVHFVVLNSAIPKGQNGHLGRQDIAWLTADLSGLAPETPVVIFTHHPLLYDEGRYSTVYTDNDWDLMPLLKAYNIIALFSGHGHLHLYWEVNGISGVMVKAAMENGYAAVDVDPARGILNVRALALTENALNETVSTPEAVWEIPLKRASAADDAFQIVSPAPNVTADRSLLVQARCDWDIFPSIVEYRIETGAWKTLPALVNQPGLYEKTLDLSDVDPGVRTLWIRAMTQDDRSFAQCVPFIVSRPDTPIKPLWETQTGGAIQGTPAVNDTAVYIGNHAGLFCAFDRHSGASLWTAQTDSAIIASPLLTGDMVYAVTGKGTLYAWNAVSGQLIWQQSTQDPVSANPVFDGIAIYLAGAQGSVTALNPATGQILWQKPHAAKAIISAPAIGDPLLYFGSWDNYFYAVNKYTGDLAWKQIIGAQTYYAPAAASPLFYNGRVYVSTPGNQVLCMDASNGATLWSVKASSGLSSPILYNHAIMYSTMDGALYALDPDTGANLWQTDNPQSNYGSSPVAQEGTVLLSGLAGKLAGVHVDQKQVAWNIKVDDAYIMSDPAVWQHQIYIGTFSGKLAAYESPPAESPAPFPNYAAFTDTVSHWARADLNQLSQKQWIRGFEDGTYRPNDPVTRGQLAAMINRVLGDEAPPAGFVSAFKDIDGHWASSSIMALEAQAKAPGYTDADGNPVFLPDQPATRAEAALFLAAAILSSQVSDPFFPSKFADIEQTPEAWAIKALESQGFVGGFLENGIFYYKPANTLTRAEIGVLLLRIFH